MYMDDIDAEIPRKYKPPPPMMAVIVANVYMITCENQQMWKDWEIFLIAFIQLANFIKNQIVFPWFVAIK